MGFFSRLMFWKKDDLDELPEFDEFKGDFGLPKSQEFPGSFEPLASKPPVAAVQPAPQPSSFRDTELILAKLDAIKVSLDNLNIRLERLEKLARSEEVYR